MKNKTPDFLILVLDLYLLWIMIYNKYKANTKIKEAEVSFSLVSFTFYPVLRSR